MPTYDYVCDACNHKFELFQSINDPVQRKCPQCKKSKLRRLFGTGAAIMFKGSGFYQTDYRSESYKKAASADTGGDSDAKSSKDSKDKGSSAKQDSGAADKSSPKTKPSERKAKDK